MGNISVASSMVPTCRAAGQHSQQAVISSGHAAAEPAAVGLRKRRRLSQGAIQHQYGHCAQQQPLTVLALVTCGMAISSRPKKSFWKPPLEAPGCTTTATDGVARPHRKSKSSMRCTGSCFLQAGAAAVAGMGLGRCLRREETAEGDGETVARGQLAAAPLLPRHHQSVHGSLSTDR